MLENCGSGWCMYADHKLSNVVALCAASHAGWGLCRSLDDVWVHAVDQINCWRTSMASNIWWLCMVVWDESRPESEVCGDGIHPRANEALCKKRFASAMEMSSCI